MATNFSVLVAYWIWLVLFLSEKYQAVSLKKKNCSSKRVIIKKDNLSHLKEGKKCWWNFLRVQILAKIVVVAKFAKIK